MELDIYIAVIATIGAAVSVAAFVWNWRRHRRRIVIKVLPTVSEGTSADGCYYRYDTMRIRVLNNGEQDIRVDRVFLIESDGQLLNVSNMLAINILVPAKGSYDFVLDKPQLIDMMAGKTFKSVSIQDAFDNHYHGGISEEVSRISKVVKRQ